MKDEIKQILEQSLDYEFDLTFKQRKELLDYITNLQEENERLIKLKERYQLEKEVYKSRIDKANEVLKDTSVDMPETLLIETIDYARHILNGDDNN